MKTKKHLFTGLLIVAIVMIAGLILIFPKSTKHPVVKAAAPAFTVDPHEEWDNSTYGSGVETESSNLKPTTAGTDIDFKATATDPESDDYYLAICKTDAITPVNNAMPSCDGGDWDLAGPFTSGSEATATYSTSVSDDNQNEWYAFICDHNASSTCSSSFPGVFYVNHQPEFVDNFSVTDVNGGDAQPGEQLKFNFEADDADGDGVTVVVCDTTFNDVTRTCDNEELCRTDVGWFPLTSGTSEGLTSIHFYDDNIGWVSGGIFGSSNLIFKTTDGGNNWTQQSATYNDRLINIHFYDANNGWAVGFDGTTILHTTNGGTTWSSQSSGFASTDYLYGIYAIDANKVVIAGRNGKIIKTTDGGANWSPVSSGTTEWLWPVHFVDADTGWIAGSNGIILKTTDGGSSWSPQTSGTTNYLTDLYSLDLNNSWAVGMNGAIINTTDGGVTWNPQTSGVSDHLYGVYFVDTYTGWANGVNGTILNTADGGTTWNLQISGFFADTGFNTFLDIHFFDANTGWMIGEYGTILKTTNGGGRLGSCDEADTDPNDTDADPVYIGIPQAHDVDGTYGNAPAENRYTVHAFDEHNFPDDSTTNTPEERFVDVKDIDPYLGTYTANNTALTAATPTDVNFSVTVYDDNGDNDITGVTGIIFNSSTVSSESDGIINGNDTYGWLGYEIHKGDFNGNNHDDLIASNRFNYIAIFLDGSIPASVADADVIITDSTTDANFGRGGIFVADLNDDDDMDLVVGDPTYDNWRGHILIFYGNGDGTFGTSSCTTGCTIADADVEIIGENLYQHFHFIATGDLDDDGDTDLLVTATDYGIADEGRAYIFYNDGTGVYPASAAGADVIIDWDDGKWFGQEPAVADLNNDNKDDLIIASSGYNSITGRIYIFYNDGTGVYPASAAGADVMITGENTNDSFYHAGSGDLNNDSKTDLIVAAGSYDGGGTDRGRVYVFYQDGSWGTSACTTDCLAANADVKITGENDNDYLRNFDVGDLDNDGDNDLVVGAGGYNSNNGRAYIFYQDGSYPSLADDADVIIDAEEGGPFTYFAWPILTIDINNDNKTDLVTSAALFDADLNWNAPGRVYVFLNDGTGVYPERIGDGWCIENENNCYVDTACTISNQGSGIDTLLNAQCDYSVLFDPGYTAASAEYWKAHANPSDGVRMGDDISQIFLLFPFGFPSHTPTCPPVFTNLSNLNTQLTQVGESSAIELTWVSDNPQSNENIIVYRGLGDKDNTDQMLGITQASDIEDPCVNVLTSKTSCTNVFTQSGNYGNYYTYAIQARNSCGNSSDPVFSDSIYLPGRVEEGETVNLNLNIKVKIKEVRDDPEALIQGHSETLTLEVWEPGNRISPVHTQEVTTDIFGEANVAISGFITGTYDFTIKIPNTLRQTLVDVVILANQVNLDFSYDTFKFGDWNDDGAINLQDIQIISTGLAENPEKYDLNEDGEFSLEDVMEVLMNWRE